MEQTAVEWFHKETWNLKIKLENKVISIGQYANSYQELFEQAKEMEKQQREKDFLAGNNCACMEHENIEDYFNRYIKS